MSTRDQVSEASVGSFDYVIVGGGAAGSVLAARLTEDPYTTVCVLEAGPEDFHPLIHIPAGVIKLLFNPSVAWQFKTEGSFGTNGRNVFAPQGKVLGGSSSINGMIYNRGLPSDFNGWAQLGSRGWSYDDVLPYFKKSERRIGPGDEHYRGRVGGIPVSDNNWITPLTEAFLEGAQTLGIPRNPDYNGASQAGVGYMQRAIENGRRVSAARAYLKPARKRANLSVIPNAQATKIIFEGKRATGILFAHSKSRERKIAYARREVIISSGSINTPKLLQISGVGPRAVLKSLGISPVHEMPGVGRNLSDHFGMRTVVEVKNTPTANELSRWPRLGGEIFKWLVGRPSILGMSSSIANVFWRSDEHQEEPDLQFVFTPLSFKAGLFGMPDDFPGVSLGMWPHRPQSRGYVAARSANPFEDPIIQPNYLQAEYDQRMMVAAIRLSRRLLSTPQFSKFVVRESVPGPSRTTDDELLDVARQTGSTIYHFVGTSRMGPKTDVNAVVDDRLRIHGLENIRIVDASIMPDVPSGNTYAPTLMIAEKGADLIREEAHQN
ncbi:GMC family oxidoreductase [Leptospira interrogans]